MNDLKGKIALVTGATSGIGKSTTDLLRSNGVTVYTAQRTKLDENTIIADFNNPGEAENIMRNVSKKTSRLDILINNAGIMSEISIEDMTLFEWNAHLMVNLTFPFLLIKFGLPLMKKNGCSIVNIGSIEGLGSNPKHSAYCASKGGLHALTRAVAVDHGNAGIRCNAVAPGWVNTPLNHEFINSLPDPETFKDRIGKIHPLGRVGNPEEIAELIVWLSSNKSSFMTGQVLTIDGGRMAKLSLP